MLRLITFLFLKNSVLLIVCKTLQTVLEIGVSQLLVCGLLKVSGLILRPTCFDYN